MGKTMLKLAFIADKFFFFSPGNLSIDFIQLGIVESPSATSLIIFIFTRIDHSILKFKYPSPMFFAFNKGSSVLSLLVREFSFPSEELVFIKASIVLKILTLEIFLFIMTLLFIMK